MTFARRNWPTAPGPNPSIRAAWANDSKRWWDYTESNSWQATFLNQHDLAGAIRLFGGDQAYIDKLDALFSASSDLPPDAPPDMAA
ncbi:MAG: glycoside hydrolase domain-containing protein [Asticcacaulis sp.]